ncbi:hypothetical protein Tco_0619799 [Tanacetum coccineum]
MWLMELELIVVVLLPKRYLLLVVVYVSFRMETTLNSWFTDDDNARRQTYYKACGGNKLAQNQLPLCASAHESDRVVQVVSVLGSSAICYAFYQELPAARAGTNGRPSAPTIDSRGNNIDKHHNCQCGELIIWKLHNTDSGHVWKVPTTLS